MIHEFLLDVLEKLSFNFNKIMEHMSGDTELKILPELGYLINKTQVICIINTLFQLDLNRFNISNTIVMANS